jgi:hypothetical protein
MFTPLRTQCISKQGLALPEPMAIVSRIWKQGKKRPSRFW